MDIQKLINDYSQHREEFLVRKGKYQNLLSVKKSLEESKRIKEEHLEVLEKTKILLAESSKYGKEKVKAQLETLVTSGLQYVFEDDRRFEIDIPDGKSRTEAEFFVVTNVNGEEVRTRPQEANGGGVVDIICLILRVAMLQSTSPSPQGPMVLDEPVKMVSSEYVPKVGEFIQQLKEYFGRQVIMATHNNFLAEIGDVTLMISQPTENTTQIDVL